jgi:hypothetical protein
MTTTAAGAGILIGYARCSTDEQDLTAQRGILLELGVTEDRIYLDHFLDQLRPGPRPSGRGGCLLWGWRRWV